MVKILKVKNSGVPKAKDLEDISRTVEVTASNTTNLENIFKYAVVELGRQIAKQWAGKDLVAAAGLAAELNEAVNRAELGFDNNYQFRNLLNNEYNLPYDWTIVDNCGNTKHIDSNDLYEDTVVKFVIHVERKVKDKKSLADLGVK